MNHEPIDPGGHPWKDVVAEAMSEPDPKSLHEKIAVAEAAIFERLQMLAANSYPQSEEIRELREASDALLALKTTVLKFPHWRQQ